MVGKTKSRTKDFDGRWFNHVGIQGRCDNPSRGRRGADYSLEPPDWQNKNKSIDHEHDQRSPRHFGQTTARPFQGCYWKACSRWCREQAEKAGTEKKRQKKRSRHRKRKNPAKRSRRKKPAKRSPRRKKRSRPRKKPAKKPSRQAGVRIRRKCCAEKCVRR